MSFKSQNSLTVTKMSWQWIPDDGSSDSESSLRKFSSWQDEVWGIRRTYGTRSDLDLKQVGEVRRVRSLQRYTLRYITGS